LVVAYYSAAHLGYALQFSGPVAALMWLPVGVGVAFLYLGGLRLWPGVVIGDLLVNDYATLPFGTALVQSIGNLLEVLVVTLLLLRLCPREEPLGTLRGVLGMVAAIACGTLLSATIGSMASWLGDVFEARSLPYVWRTWWLGDFTGALIVLPLALAWSSLPARPWQRGRMMEASLMVAVVTGLSALQLGRPVLLSALVFPALIWAALDFGLRGATVAITIICGFAIWGATNDLGPFGVGTINDRLLETQLFIATVSLTALAIAALVAERAQLAEHLRASRTRLVASSDQARQRLERDLHDGAQQGILGLRLKLTLATEALERDPEEGQRLLTTIERQMDGVLEELRSLAHGVYPPMLREYGIVSALESAALHMASPVSVHGAGVGRYSQATEAAVYFSCLEALQNVAKHAGPDANADVRLRQQSSELRFEVTDSGTGFDPATTFPGTGQANMRDRIEAVGGTLTVVSRPRNGTTVRGRVPIR
jgi:signal transduction histidine kinase